MRDKLKAKGIPEYADMLRRKYGYDPNAQKRRINPREAELIDDTRRGSGNTAMVVRRSLGEGGTT